MPPATTDPNDIRNPTDIPPSNAIHVGLSPDGLVDVYCGTLQGDVDATPAAQELLSASPDTGGLANADYIYDNVSKLYGGVGLPDVPTGAGVVKSVAFVSGSAQQGPYGAFHMGNLPDFDRLVLDSLTTSGDYSSGSGLAGGRHAAPRTGKAFVSEDIPGLLGVTHVSHPRLKNAAKKDRIRALVIANRSVHALESTLRTRSLSNPPPPKTEPDSFPSSKDLDRLSDEELAHRLVQANLLTLAHLKGALATAAPGRQYLSTALFAAEIVESFQVAANNADPGQTDGEAVSRVLAFKLAPEIALVPGFNAGVTQKWWQDNHPDFVNDNSQNDRSDDGNAAGVMFLLFLNDYLGVPLDQIIQAMPREGGAPLGKTYEALRAQNPALAGGANGTAAFKEMISLLREIQNPDGTLNLPADGNPFPAINGSRRGGLFAVAAASSNTFAQDAQAALALEAQLEQQTASLRDTLSQIQAAAPPAALTRSLRRNLARAAQDRRAASFSYGPRLPASVAAGLAQRAAAYRAPQVDQLLQQKFWPHVYNELPGSGTQTYRLQVITGTDDVPQAVQITGTVQSTKQEADGDLHVSFVPDDTTFPANQSASESPLEIEVIYAGPVTQADAKKAQQGYTNPLDITLLSPGARVRVAGPLIYDRAHGKVDANGNVQYGLEIHPATTLELVGAGGGGGGAGGNGGVGGGGGANPSPLATNVATALRESVAVGQTVANLTALLQKIQGEVPRG